MATLSDIRDRTYRVLADPNGQQYQADLLDDGIAAALEAILPWVFKRSIVIFNGDEETVSFALPADLYQIIAVFDEDSGYYLPKNILSAGVSPGDNIQSNQDWMEYPNGYLSLANAPTGSITVHYAAVWDPVIDDEDEIEPPDWCHRALVFYAASYALLDKASSASNIRQWNMNVDSGTPAMNPMWDMSENFLTRFYGELSRMPANERGVSG